MEINNFIFSIFISGILFNMLQDLIISITDYLREKAWKVQDYERIISNYIYSTDLMDKVFKDNNISDHELVTNAYVNYRKREIKRKNLDRFLNRFRRNKKDV